MKTKIKKFFSHLLSISKEPKHIAFSIGLGLFFGIIIPIGLQTIIVIPFAIMLRANVYLSTAATLITNPVTIVPVYLITFRIGSFLLGYDLKWEQINYVLDSPTFSNLSELGWDILIPLLFGNFVFAIIISVIAYFLFFYLIKFYNKRKIQHHSAL